MDDFPVATLVRVEIVSDGTYYYASSDDVFGLHACSKDREALERDIPKLIKALYRANKSVAVEVKRFCPADQFPALAVRGDQFVLEAISDESEQEQAIA